MSTPGRESAPRASSQKSTAIFRFARSQSLSHNLVSPTSTSTWWAPSSGFNHILTVIDRTSRWMEALPWLTPPHQRSQRHYFQGGFTGLVYQPSSHLTEEHNLPPIFGIHCVFCCRSGTSQQPHTTHRPTGWRRDYTPA